MSVVEYIKESYQTLDRVVDLQVKKWEHGLTSDEILEHLAYEETHPEMEDPGVMLCMVPYFYRHPIKFTKYIMATFLDAFFPYHM